SVANASTGKLLVTGVHELPLLVDKHTPVFVPTQILESTTAKQKTPGLHNPIFTGIHWAFALHARRKIEIDMSRVLFISGISLKSFRPIFQGNSLNSFEMICVICNHYQIMS